MVAEARERSEALLEIDARAEAGGRAASCVRCGGHKRVRWGRTRTGVQRWRCSGCHATWSGRTGTPLARMHRPDLVVALARDMIEAPQPMSCRSAAQALGASHHTIWRWRIAISRRIRPSPTMPSPASSRLTRRSSERADRARESGSGIGATRRTTPRRRA